MTIKLTCHDSFVDVHAGRFNDRFLLMRYYVRLDHLMSRGSRHLGHRWVEWYFLGGAASAICVVK